MFDDVNDIDELFDAWAEAGGTSAHPSIKKALYQRARQLGFHLPGMPRTEEV
ncbi:MAG TPA: hypothetical protein VFM34_00145 [Moraxellaceae bacterium]|nr:hypothetical protein [Moraxellaceae bacterium]